MGRLKHRTSPGWTYFVTTKAWQNQSFFQVQETSQILIDKILEYRGKGDYLLHEFVVMPNHLHLILTPQDAVTLEKAMQLIKGGSSHKVHRVRGIKMQIWQSGFHESRVIDHIDYKKKSDYIIFNPVAAKLVGKPEDWLFGSACGKYQLDPIPQGLKPHVDRVSNVGPKGPTPNAPAATSGAKAPTGSTQLPGLKPRPPKEYSQAAAKNT
jgi:putative transposase